MDKKILFFITFLLLSCTIFAQKGNQNPTDSSVLREERIELIVSFNGDFTISDMKQVRKDLAQINVRYLGYCMDQKCMIVSVVKYDENSGDLALEKIKSLSPGKVMGLKLSNFG